MTQPAEGQGHIAFRHDVTYLGAYVTSLGAYVTSVGAYIQIYIDIYVAVSIGYLLC